MDKIRLGLVGCGGMGTRHLYGLRELMHTPFNNIELVALCDIRRENAELAAAEVEKLLGIRPEIFTDLEVMARKVPELHAVDVVTDPSLHHTVVCQALNLNLHVMVEKPLGITVKTCQKMIDAAQQNNRKLSVAENYRRDPSARLVNHLLKAGAIGTPYMALFHALSAGRSIFITPWRHLKDKGGLILDMGVHFTDLIRYQLGDVAEVYGDVRLTEAVRHKPERIGDTYTFYQNRFKAMDATVPATAEDTSMATFRMQNGVTVSWVMGNGGHGRCGSQLILGTQGCINGFGTRGGKTSLTCSGQREKGYEELLAETEEFTLEPLAQHFFPNRISGDGVDWKLIALEYYEFAEAILNGRELEVDGVEGLKDVAAIYAIFESAMCGQPVKMSDIEDGSIYAYQAEIDDALGLAEDR